MITLTRFKKQQEQNNANSNTRISVRDKLLTREVQEMSQLLPSNCTVTYDNENDLSSFILNVKPTEGYWQDGCFKFHIKVTEEYNMVVCIEFLSLGQSTLYLLKKNIFLSPPLLNASLDCGTQTLMKLVKYAYPF